MYNYASVLFTGVCNANCPSCIGKRKEFKDFKSNLSLYPLPGIDKFINELTWAKTEYISFSGILADPQQYEHEIKLIN